LINGDRLKAGDVLIGVASNGLHSNGFSLVRHLINDYERDFKGEPLWKELLKPTRIYVKAVQELLKNHTVKAIAHITGGGIYENVPRMSPKLFNYYIEKEKIPNNPIFDYIAKLGVNEENMFNTFNMGVGLVIAVASDIAEKACSTLESCGEKAFILGTVEDGGKGVCLR